MAYLSRLIRSLSALTDVPAHAMQVRPERQGIVIRTDQSALPHQSHLGTLTNTVPGRVWLATPSPETMFCETVDDVLVACDQIPTVDQLSSLHVSSSSSSSSSSSPSSAFPRCYGSSSLGQGRTILLDYSSPNVAKPFHAGHLRSTNIGACLQRLYAYTGHRTVSINYLGDWGKQYGMLGVGLDLFADASAQTMSSVDLLKHLVDVYVRVHQHAETDPSIHDRARHYLSDMERGHEPLIARWKHLRALSLPALEDMYARLRVRFDAFHYESDYVTAAQQYTHFWRQSIDASPSPPQQQQPPAQNTLRFFDDKGGLFADLGDELGSALLARSHSNTTTYLSRDYAAAVDRYEKYKPDEILYVVGKDQRLHFARLFALLRDTGHEWAAHCCHHIDVGAVTGMSTRAGRVVLLSDVLDEATTFMREWIDHKRPDSERQRTTDPSHAAHVLGLSAVVVQDVYLGRTRPYAFDWTRMCSPSGTTGPYLQFTHTRLCGIARHGRIFADPTDPCAVRERTRELLRCPATLDAIKQLTITNNNKNSNSSNSTTPHESTASLHRLTWQLSTFPITIERSLAARDPSPLVRALVETASAANAACHMHRVADEPDRARAAARALLFMATQRVLATGLALIGLDPLDRI